MHRLVFPGFPCSDKTWIEMFKHSDTIYHTQVFTFAKMLERCEKVSIKNLVNEAKNIILAHPNASIICHDYGAFYVIKALNELNEQNIKIKAKVTILNSCFLNAWNIFKASYPLRFQFKNIEDILEEGRQNGSIPDPAIRVYWPTIRKFYIAVTLCGIANIFTRLLGIKPNTEKYLGIPSLLLQSNNDPYIPSESVEALATNFNIDNVIHIDYGHFPTQCTKNSLRDIIEKFEISH